MFPILNLGPLAAPMGPLSLLFGFWLALTIFERQAKHANLPALTGERLYNLAFVALLAGLVGARLAFAALHPAAFAADPLSLVSLSPQLLEPLGGLLVAGLAGAAYAWRNRLPAWPTLDALAPSLAILWLALGFSHLATGAAYGLPTSLPWAIHLWEADRHPTQVYEMLAGALVLAAVWRPRPRPGQRFWLFAGLSAAAYLLIAGLQAEAIFLANGLRLGQLLAWLVLAVSLWALRPRLTEQPDGELTHAP